MKKLKSLNINAIATTGGPKVYPKFRNQLRGWCKECNSKMLYSAYIKKRRKNTIDSTFKCINSKCANYNKVMDDGELISLSPTKIQEFKRIEVFLDFLRGYTDKKLELKYKYSKSYIHKIRKSQRKLLEGSKTIEKIYEICVTENQSIKNEVNCISSDEDVEIIRKMNMPLAKYRNYI